MPLSTNAFEILPRNALASCLSDCTIAFTGVTAGFVIYLCLKMTDSDPRTDFFKENQPW